MTESELLARLQILMTPQIGPITFRHILKTFGSAEKALSKLSARQKISPSEQAEKQLENLYQYQQEMTWYDEENYPSQLKKLEDAPPVLIYKGILKKIKNIAMVGTRNASLPALDLTKEWASVLAEKGYGIISGLAYGIDTAAHQGALLKQGYTIAVLAGSVEEIYPEKNTKLYHQILENGGAIVSQHFPEISPSAALFPSRNRIIAGVSDITVIMEAKRKSGSLITADYAKKYNRPVAAVPGFPSDERATGPNFLIKEQQAFLVESPKEIEDIMVRQRITQTLWGYEEIQEENTSFLAENQTEDILRLLTKTPILISKLATHLGLKYTDLMPTLIVLDLEKKIKILPQNYVIRL